MAKAKFRDERKLGVDLTEEEASTIYGIVRIASHKSRFTINPHLFHRLRQKHIFIDDVANTIERGELIEFHVVDNSPRALLRLHKHGTNTDVCVVVELVNFVVITAYTNQSSDTHSTLKQELYDDGLDVLAILDECKQNQTVRYIN